MNADGTSPSLPPPAVALSCTIVDRHPRHQHHDHRHQQQQHHHPPPDHCLVVDLGMRIPSPRKLRAKLRPEANACAPRSPHRSKLWVAPGSLRLGDTIAWDTVSQHATGSAAAAGREQRFLGEASQFDVYSGGLRVAEVATTGVGPGLLKTSDKTAQPVRHPFVRVEILATGTAEDALLGIADATRTLDWGAFCRSLVRSGFSLQGQPLPEEVVQRGGLTAPEEPASRQAFALWDTWCLSAHTGLEEIAPAAWLRAEGSFAVPERIEPTYPLCGGRSLPFLCAGGRFRSMFCDGFVFGKRLAPPGPFISLDTGRAVLPTTAGRVMPRCVGVICDSGQPGQKGLYRSLGDPLPPSVSIFRHPSVSMSEFTNASMRQLRDKADLRSPILRLYMETATKAASQLPRLKSYHHRERESEGEHHHHRQRRHHSHRALGNGSLPFFLDKLRHLGVSIRHCHSHVYRKNSTRSGHAASDPRSSRYALSNKI